MYNGPGHSVNSLESTATTVDSPPFFRPDYRRPELCEQAEVNRKMTLVAQANSMRKTAKEKAVSVDKINKELDERLKEL